MQFFQFLDAPLIFCENVVMFCDKVLISRPSYMYFYNRKEEGEGEEERLLKQNTINIIGKLSLRFTKTARARATLRSVNTCMYK